MSKWVRKRGKLLAVRFPQELLQIVWWELQCKPLAAWPVCSHLQTCLEIPAVLSLFKGLHTCVFTACLCPCLSSHIQSLFCPSCPRRRTPGILWRAEASRSVLPSALPFGTCERRGPWHPWSLFASRIFLTCRNRARNWRFSAPYLQSVRSPGGHPTVVPTSARLRSWAVGSTLVGVSGPPVFLPSVPSCFHFLPHLWHSAAASVSGKNIYGILSLKFPARSGLARV